jgi:hypothetical protein
MHSGKRKTVFVVKLHTCSPSEPYDTPRGPLTSISFTHAWNYNFSYIARVDQSFIQYLCHPHFPAQVWPLQVSSPLPPSFPSPLLSVATLDSSYVIRARAPLTRALYRRDHKPKSLLVTNIRIAWNSGGRRTKKFSTEVEVYFGQTVSRPVCLGVRRPTGISDQFCSFSLKFSLDSCRFVIL